MYSYLSFSQVVSLLLDVFTCRETLTHYSPPSNKNPPHPKIPRGTPATLTQQFKK